MDSRGAMLSSIEELVRCPTCACTLNDARLLKCGHSVCYGCMVEASKHPNGWKCPVCGVYPYFELPKNFTVDSISEIVRALRENETRNVWKKTCLFFYNIVILMVCVALAGIRYAYILVTSAINYKIPLIDAGVDFLLGINPPKLGSASSRHRRPKGWGSTVPRFVCEVKKQQALLIDSSRAILSCIEEILRCSECNATLQDARFLHCGHTVCHGCVQRRKENPDYTLECAFCKEDNGVYWQKNYTATDVSEFLKTLPEHEQNSISETICDYIHSVVVIILSIILAVLWIACVCLGIPIVFIVLALTVFARPCIFFGNRILYFLGIIIAEIVVIMREQHWYKATLCYLAKTMTVLPVQMILVICGGIVYWMTNQPNESIRFVGFLSLATMMQHALGSISHIMHRAFLFMFQEEYQEAHQEVAAYMYLDPVKIPPFSASPILLFVGFFVNLNTMSHYLQWLFYTSYVRGELVCDRDDRMDYLFKVLDVQDAKFHFGFIIFCLLFSLVLDIARLFIRRSYVKILWPLWHRSQYYSTKETNNSLPTSNAIQNYIRSLYY